MSFNVLVLTTFVEFATVFVQSFDVSGQCFFNETSCACGVRSPEKGSASCLEMFDFDPRTGRALCMLQECEASYVCQCEGTELCNRVETTKQAYVQEEADGHGYFFCSRAPVTQSVNIVQVGVPIPTPAATESLSPFNATHCRCSLKNTVVAPHECTDFLRTESHEAIICKTRVCAIGDHEYSCDGIGSSYCTRKFRESTYFVNDGKNSGGPGWVYCHQLTSDVEIVRRIK